MKVPESKQDKHIKFMNEKMTRCAFLLEMGYIKRDKDDYIIVTPKYKRFLNKLGEK